MKYLLETNNLTKQYGKQKAVNKVNIHVKQGEIYGLIGRNGAGKTTFMKMISGLSIPTEGSFTFFNEEGVQGESLKTRIGVLIEEPGIYPNLSAKDNLKLKSFAMGVRNHKEMDELLSLVGLSEVADKKVKKFSLGMKQRLGIALALVGSPDLVILDEPINGLDPQGISEIREMILELNKEQNITFIISSHILEELSKIATTYGIIHQGELLQELSQEELWNKCSERIELRTDDVAKAGTVLDKIGIADYKVVDASSIHIFEKQQESDKITAMLVKEGVKVQSISVNSENLEEYYLNLTGGSANV